MESKYDELKTQYPPVISINQFYQICHVAKRSAVSLLEKGIVPYTDTGKKTWKYQIKLDDVIVFLENRDLERSKASQCIRSRRKKRKSTGGQPTAKSFRKSIQGKSPDLIVRFFEQSNPNCPDMLTAAQVSEITGLGVNIVRQKIRMGELAAVSNWNVYYIPKKCFYKFLASPHFYDIACFGEHFGKNLSAFEAWLKDQDK